MKELVLGAGHYREKRIFLDGNPKYKNPIFLDAFEFPGINVVFDMNKVGFQKLPFKDQEFDEIHAYDCLEHWGTQGDFYFFFHEFNEYYRILKPDGEIFIFVPLWKGRNVWCDPGHVRVFHSLAFDYLDWEMYKQIDKGTACSDYRQLLRCNFRMIKHEEYEKEATQLVILKKLQLPK